MYYPEGYFISNYRHNYYERVFSRGEFGMGGRLYSHWILGIPKELRRSVLLNQEETIELDYSSMNMHIMSSLENLSSNSGKDLYQIGTLKGLNREMIKQFITIAPNVKNITSAKKLTAKELLQKLRLYMQYYGESILRILRGEKISVLNLCFMNLI
jgi:radical SAM superfamily enzyme